MRDFGERVVREVERSARVRLPVIASIIAVIEDDMLGPNDLLPQSLDVRTLYRSAIEVRDCRLASDLIWREFIRTKPFLEGVRADSYFQRLLVRDVFVPHLPELAACLYAQDGRTLHHFVATLSSESRENQLQGTPLQHLRPFVYHRSWATARGTVHGRRDWNYVQLIEMAATPTRPNFGPAGVMLVELALELDSLNLPDDILHMLLLRAEATWPEVDDDKPLPIERSRIAALLPVTEARLTEDALAHAERCFLTDEPYDRLFLGEQAYAALPDTKRCQPSPD